MPWALQIRLLAERGPRPRGSSAHGTNSCRLVVSRTRHDGGRHSLSAVGEKDKAFEEAEKVAKAKPDDPATQTWFADIAAAPRKPTRRKRR